ncbi:MAG: trigger factor [Lachnospiraceae bacterium]|nr:trigger factor [Lachnospiraceae bacterium]
MKKQYTVAALFLVIAMVLTGCSWEDVKEKFIGSNTAGDGVATGSAVVEIEDYDVDDCITLAKYKGVEVDCTVSEEELQAEIDSLIQSNIPYNKKKGTAKEGDPVKIDYTGKKDGVAFDGGTAEDAEITLGSSGFIDGFDDGVVGMKVGETKDLNLTFPEEYPNDPSLAGQDVVFTVTLKAVGKLPKYDDALVKKATDYETTAEFEKAKKKELSETKKNQAVQMQTAMGTVYSESTVKKMPETMVDAERQQVDCSYRKQLAAAYPDQSLESTLKEINTTMEEYEQQVNNSVEGAVKIKLIIQAIGEKEGLIPSEEEVKEYLSNVLANAGSSAGGTAITEEEYRSQYEDYYGKSIPFEDYVKTLCLYDKVVDFVDTNAVYKE